ncbi:MAG: aspartate kinase [Candidatus Melainabacteria bacterium]|nr:aspartate kinase [Candidatus Melainabacteria bacterium]
MNIAVLKFGGSSLKSIGRIRHVACLLASRIASGEAEKAVVVVSAMGDTTDYLLRQARRCANDPDRRELDLLLSTGEQISISLLAITLKEMGVACRSLTGSQLGIATDSCHTRASILAVDSDRLREHLADNDVVIVAGFQGVDEKGEVTTLGRGGSDTTAAALACALEAPVCEIFTDVDGVYSADPGLVKGARLWPAIGYEETLELAECGAQVIHPRAVELASDYGVRLRIRNTFRPHLDGTLIGETSEMECKESFLAVAVSSRDIAFVFDRAPGDGSLLDCLAELSGSGGCLIRSVSGNRAILALEDRESAPAIAACLEQKSGARVQVDSSFARLSLVGRKLARSAGAAARLCKGLQAVGLSPGELEVTDLRISCTIPLADCDRAVSAVCRAFDLDGGEVLSATA